MSTLQVNYPDMYNGLDPSAVNDRRERLWAAMLYLLKDNFAFDRDNKLVTVGLADPTEDRIDVDVLVPAGRVPTAPADVLSDSARVLLVSLYGHMLVHNMEDPALGRAPGAPRSSGERFIKDPVAAAGLPLRIVSRFVEEFTRGVQKFNSNRTLFERVHQFLVEVGQPPATADFLAGSAGSHVAQVSNVFARQVAEVTGRLVDQGVSAADPQIRLQIQSAVTASVAGGTDHSRLSGVNVDLPDLDSEMSVEIYSDNVRALSVLYFAAQLEDMRFFAVADEVAHQFQMGLLPLGRGAGGDALFSYIKGAPSRFTEADRRGMYARAFGFAQGGVDEAMPNMEFSDLWIRSLSAVSAFSRQTMDVRPQYGGLSGPLVVPVPVAGDYRRVHVVQVYKTMRDLAVNLSLHGFGIAHYAAIELQETIRAVRQMLSHQDVLAAYGVRDYFQLVERVARMYMNSEVNTMRQRVQAQAGSRIIQWVANRSHELAVPVAPSSNTFSDPDLVDNVEKWLAVTGTAGNTIERYSEPVPTPAQSTIPTLSMLRGMGDDVQDNLKKAVASVNRRGPLPQA